MNPVEIEEAISNLALEPFDRAEFPFQFLVAFGNKDTAIARLRAGNTNQSDIPGAVLQRGSIHITACALGAIDDALKSLRVSPADDGETETGTIYVLRSKSDNPAVSEHRTITHKIGVTSGTVESRIAGAEKSSTYLLAGVEVVATYKVYGVNCQKLEALIHKVFAAAQINLSIPDRFGHIVKPREWFLVPLHVINEAVERIRDRSILSYRYDPLAGQLTAVGRLAD